MPKCGIILSTERRSPTSALVCVHLFSSAVKDRKFVVLQSFLLPLPSLHLKRFLLKNPVFQENRVSFIYAFSNPIQLPYATIRIFEALSRGAPPATFPGLRSAIILPSASPPTRIEPLRLKDKSPVTRL